MPMGERLPALARPQERAAQEALSALLLHLPERMDPLRWWLRVALLAGFALWGLWPVSYTHLTLPTSDLG